LAFIEKIADARQLGQTVQCLFHCHQPLFLLDKLKLFLCLELHHLNPPKGFRRYIRQMLNRSLSNLHPALQS
jgi:hypothetical protein